MANIIANGLKTHTNGLTNGQTNGHKNGYLNGKTHLSHPSDLYHVNDLILHDEDRAIEVSNTFYYCMASLIIIFLSELATYYYLLLKSNLFTFHAIYHHDLILDCKQ